MNHKTILSFALRVKILMGLGALASCFAAAQSPLPAEWYYSPVWPESVAYSPDGAQLVIGGGGGLQICTLPTGVITCVPSAPAEVNSVQSRLTARRWRMAGLAASWSCEACRAAH